MQRSPLKTLTRRLAVTAATAVVVVAPLAGTAHAATYPSDTAKPDLVTLLSGYDDLWTSSGKNDLHGTVVNAGALARNDELTVWINNHATADQRFDALQDSEYQVDGGQYDQSVTISTGLGSELGPLYVKGRTSGALPLTTALVNSTNGTAGAYVSTTDAKNAYSHPRPYLATDPAAAPVPGDDPACAPSAVNGSSAAANRVGKPYADAAGNLAVERVPNVVDTTHEFSPNDVPLSPGYGSKVICTGGSFPSGHTTTAYQAGLALATLLPELAPEILARASEAGNDRIVLGVHYPLDIMGGRIDGEAALAARWSDAAYRTGVLEPARAELVSYLERQCGDTLADCVADQKPYSDDPYGGQAMPGGTAQVVTDRRSAVEVYTERLTYGFDRVGEAGQAPSVPAGASNLLLTTFPTLTDAQRTEVLAQTEVGSGYPLDTTGTAVPSWQRLNLASAMSATVTVDDGGCVNVVATGGEASVVEVHAHGRHGHRHR